MSEVIFNKEQLEQKLKYWQSKLRLNDWKINAQITRDKDMSQRDRLGEVEYNIYKKEAFIRILDPVDYDDYGKQDMENTLVHELLHIHFSGICYHFGKNDDVYNVLEEQAIESITSGLISLERKGSYFGCSMPLATNTM